LLSISVVLCTDRFARDRVPSALILTLIGLAIACVYLGDAGEYGFAPQIPVFLAASSITWDDIWNGFLKAGLAQLPLTTLNIVIAVVDLYNKSLFPDDPKQHVSRRSVACGVAFLNLSGLWFGSMPLCHGAAGLAGQYRFGARHGSSVIFLGVLKILSACLMGSQSQVLLAYFPRSILGPLVIFSGVSPAMAGRKCPVTSKKYSHSDNELLVTVSTATFTSALGSGWGFVAGMVACLFYHSFDSIIADSRA